MHEIPVLSLPPDKSATQHQVNFYRKYDFLPQLDLPNSEPLKVIYAAQLLGGIISSDLSWAEHVDDMTARAIKKLWILIRFKALGATKEQLKTVVHCTPKESGPPWNMLPPSLDICEV